MSHYCALLTSSRGSRGKWEIMWISRILSFCPLYADPPLSITMWLLLGPFRNKMFSEVERMGEGLCRPLLSVFCNNRTCAQLLQKEGLPVHKKWRIQSFCKLVWKVFALEVRRISNDFFFFSEENGGGLQERSQKKCLGRGIISYILEI